MTRTQVFVLAAGLFSPAVGAADAGAIDCVIEPRSIIELSFADEGIIAQVHVKRGEHVEAGSIVARLEDAVERLQVELAAVRAESDVEFRSQKTRRELRRRELNRARELREKNVASSAQLDEAEIEAALTELAVENAKIDQQLAQIEHQQAQARLARRQLTSPVDGIVMSVDVEAGQFAHEQLQIARVAEIDPLHVEVFAPARLFEQIRIGQTYKVQPMAPLKGLFDARVSVVDPVFDAASGTFGVRLEIANPDGAIPAGIRCRLLEGP